MAIEERTRPHQTCINYNPDGSFYVTHRSVLEVLRDGAVITQSISEPQSIREDDQAAVQALQSLLGEGAAAAVRDSRLMADEIGELSKRAEAAEARLAAVVQAAAGETTA